MVKSFAQLGTNLNLNANISKLMAFMNEAINYTEITIAKVVLYAANAPKQRMVALLLLMKS